MAVIHCTQKLLKELGNPPLVGVSGANSEGLANWYANLLRINRRKCVLFTNEKSLYSFIVPNAVKAHFMDFRTVFLTHLTLNLMYAGFSQQVIERVRAEHREIFFAKTTSRSVLGSMNDFAFQYECYISSSGGTLNADIMAINSKVNESPMSLLKYERPMKALKGFLSASL
jgi:hypothetical protein